MKIGLNQDTLDNLMVGIYNKFQEEILDLLWMKEDSTLLLAVQEVQH